MDQETSVDTTASMEDLAELLLENQVVEKSKDLFRTNDIESVQNDPSKQNNEEGLNGANQQDEERSLTKGGTSRRLPLLVPCLIGLPFGFWMLLPLTVGNIDLSSVLIYISIPTGVCLLASQKMTPIGAYQKSKNVIAQMEEEHFELLEEQKMDEEAALASQKEEFAHLESLPPSKKLSIKPCLRRLKMACKISFCSFILLVVMANIKSQISMINSQF